MLVLDSNNAVADGLTLTGAADGSTIRGFVIRDFTDDGISIQAGSINNVIAGNHIGRLNADGTAAAAGKENTGDGIEVLGASNTIGGTTAAERNVISGNGLNGILISGASATGNTVLGNYIGTAADGTTALGNGDRGIRFDSWDNNSIGGTTAAARKIIVA